MVSTAQLNICDQSEWNKENLFISTGCSFKLKSSIGETFQKQENLIPFPDCLRHSAHPLADETTPLLSLFSSLLFVFCQGICYRYGLQLRWVLQRIAGWILQPCLAPECLLLFEHMVWRTFTELHRKTYLLARNSESLQGDYSQTVWVSSTTPQFGTSIAHIVQCPPWLYNPVTAAQNWREFCAQGGTTVHLGLLIPRSAS